MSKGHEVSDARAEAESRCAGQVGGDRFNTASRAAAGDSFHGKTLMTEGRCCPRCPCACNAGPGHSSHDHSSGRRTDGTSQGAGGAGGGGGLFTATPLRSQDGGTQERLTSRLEQTRARLQSLRESTREMSGGIAGSGGHEVSFTMNELLILRRRVQTLETRLEQLEQRMSRDAASAAYSERMSGGGGTRSLETLKRNVIRAVTREFDQF